ncbi:MAG: hypothetical protein IJV97_02845 [Alphaproteobacteria bacterium]|nr:hypothetical protein [Alphaproteobacteria bacterium]
MDANSSEIIEATQNAVLSVADSVTNAIENATINMSGHSEPFYLSAEFWVAMSFVLVVVGLAYPISKIAKKMLRKRARLIAKRIEDATNLKEDAQKLLANYERKFRGVKQEVQEIVQRSEKEINLMRKESLSKLENAMAVREKEAMAKIKSAQADALKEVAEITSERTVKAVKKVLKDVMTSKDYSRLIDASINELENAEL